VRRGAVRCCAVRGVEWKTGDDREQDARLLVAPWQTAAHRELTRIMSGCRERCSCCSVHVNDIEHRLHVEEARMIYI